MSIDIMTSPENFYKLSEEGFDMAIGYWLWNIAVLITPYDTGAARSSIYLKKNKPRRINISYDIFKALHIKFLEEGQGPVKKYKDFIKKDTLEAMAEQIVSYIITGKMPTYAKQGIKPFVVLGASKYKPFSREQTLLKQANMNANVISAKARSQISKIRELQYSGEKQRSSGLKPATLTNNNRGANRNMSILNRIYKERVSQI